MPHCSWRETFAPQIATVIAQAKAEKWHVTILRSVLRGARPSYPPTSHQYKMWGNEQARQLKRHLGGLPPKAFNAHARKPATQPKEQQSLF